jgi:kinesin family protein 11
VQASYASIGGSLETSFARVEALGTDASRTAGALQETLPSLSADSALRQPLADLRARIEEGGLREYAATGLTPARRGYVYPTALPRTDARDALLARLRADGPGAEEDGVGVGMFSASSKHSQFGPTTTTTTAAASSRSPGKGFVFADAPPDAGPLLSGRAGSATGPGAGATAAAIGGLLREISTNTLGGLLPPPILEAGGDDGPLPPLKRLHTSGAETKRKRGLRTTVAGLRAAAERENVTLPNLSASVGVGAVHPVAGRRLRSHERNNVH